MAGPYFHDFAAVKNFVISNEVHVCFNNSLRATSIRGADAEPGRDGCFFGWVDGGGERCEIHISSVIVDLPFARLNPLR